MTRLPDLSLIDEVWAEEGGYMLRVRHALNDQRKVQIVRLVGSSEWEVVAEVTITFGRANRISHALDGTR